MKKILATLLIIAVLASVPVFGVDNTLPELNDNEATYIDSTWINFDPEYVVWKVILTSYQDRSSIKYDISSIIKRQIEESLNESFANAKEIASQFNDDNYDYIAKTLFDLTVTDDVVKLLETKPGIKLRLKVNVGLTKDDAKPLVIHCCESKNGEWQKIDDKDYWVNEDNSLTLLLDCFCPIMVLEPTEKAEELPIEPPVVPEETNDSFMVPLPLIIILLVSVIGLIVLAIFFKRKERHEDGKIVFFAFERFKLRIQIVFARLRANSWFR